VYFDERRRKRKKEIGDPEGIIEDPEVHVP